MSIEKEAALTVKLLRGMAHEERMLDKEAQIKRDAEIGLIVDYMEKNSSVAERIISSVFSGEKLADAAPAEVEQVAQEEVVQEESSEEVVQPEAKVREEEAPAASPSADEEVVEQPEEKQADDAEAPPADAQEASKPSATVGIFNGMMSKVRKSKMPLGGEGE